MFRISSTISVTITPEAETSAIQSRAENGVVASWPILTDARAPATTTHTRRTITSGAEGSLPRAVLEGPTLAATRFF